MNEQNEKNMMNDSFTKKDKTLRILSKVLRWVIFACLLVFVLAASILHVLGYIAPSIHAICPYGGLESALSIVLIGTFIKKIFLGTFILFIITLILAVAMRRSYCGQICVFGGLQEFFGKLGRNDGFRLDAPNWGRVLSGAIGDRKECDDCRGRMGAGCGFGGVGCVGKYVTGTSLFWDGDRQSSSTGRCSEYYRGF